MKVAHLTTVDLSLRYLVFAQLESIREMGGESIGISAPGPWVEEIEAAGITHVPLPASTRGIAPLADLKAAWQLWKILRDDPPDILHTHNPKPGLYGRILGRLAGVPVVINTVHGLYAAPDDPPVKKAVVYVLEAIAARFSDLELVQSREDLALMERLHMVRPGQGQLLGNGVDLVKFDPDRTDLPGRAAMRAELGVSDDQIVVGMVGRLVAEKGYPELFEAAAELQDNYVVVAIGPDDPDKPDALPREVVESAEQAGVRFLGMRTDVDALYQALDVFVLPSHREGFPRAAMEAAAMGLPIIATDIRGCREVVDDGINGVLIPVRSPNLLKAAIERVGSDAEARQRMGSASWRKAQLAFDEQMVVHRVLEAYRTVTAEKGLTAMGEALGSGSGVAELRAAVAADAAALARMHIEGIGTGFLPRLGPRFMRLLYVALIGYDEAVVLVADSGGGAIGFVAGVADTGAFYKHFARRHGVGAAIRALPAAMRPSNLRRGWETARYGGGDEDVRAELLSMAVDTAWRGKGIALRLGRTFLAELAAREVDSVKVVVGMRNEVAQRAYQRMGFVEAGTEEVHPGETSMVLVWSA